MALELDDRPTAGPAIPPHDDVSFEAARAERLVGVDIARALALIGMFTQHAHVGGETGESSTGWVGWLFTESAGRAAVLFFVLSGVSLAMIHRNGSASARPVVLRRRGFLLLAGGLLLTISIWPASILQHYGAVFLVAPWLLQLSRHWLAIASGLGLIGGPVAMLWLPRLGDDVLGRWSGATGSWLVDQAWDLLVGGLYPLVIWIGFFTVGMSIGRIELQGRRVASGLAAFGVAATVVLGLTAGALADRFDGDEVLLDADAELGWPTSSRSSTRTACHSTTTSIGRSGGRSCTSPRGTRVGWVGRSRRAVSPSPSSVWPSRCRNGRTAFCTRSLRSDRCRSPRTSCTSRSSPTAGRPHIAGAGWSIAAQEWAFAGLVAAMILICVIFHRWLGVGPVERLLKHFMLRPGDRRPRELQHGS